MARPMPENAVADVRAALIARYLGIIDKLGTPDAERHFMRYVERLRAGEPLDVKRYQIPPECRQGLPPGDGSDTFRLTADNDLVPTDRPRCGDHRDGKRHTHDLGVGL